MIEMGLVIGSPWIDKILAGEKTWEIRSKPNSRTGRIALCKKGEPMVATCTIGVSIPLRTRDIEIFFEKHRVTPEEVQAIYGERADYYAWPLSDVERIDPPIAYEHPGGGSWVTLTRENVEEFDRLQA